MFSCTRLVNTRRVPLIQTVTTILQSRVDSHLGNAIHPRWPYNGSSEKLHPLKVSSREARWKKAKKHCYRERVPFKTRMLRNNGGKIARFKRIKHGCAEEGVRERERATTRKKKAVGKKILAKLSFSARRTFYPNFRGEKNTLKCWTKQLTMSGFARSTRVYVHCIFTGNFNIFLKY